MTKIKINSLSKVLDFQHSNDLTFQRSNALKFQVQYDGTPSIAVQKYTNG